MQTPAAAAVVPVLKTWLKKRGYEEADELVETRRAFGREKYGTELMTHNGRDATKDCLEELGDALQYMMQMRMEGKNPNACIAQSLRALQDLLDGFPMKMTCPSCGAFPTPGRDGGSVVCSNPACGILFNYCEVEYKTVPTRTHLVGECSNTIVYDGK